MRANYGCSIRDYRVTLQIGRGYNSWTSLYKAAQRFKEHPDSAILYFGDFDPSGEDMVRDMRKRLCDNLDCHAEVIKVALTQKDVIEYRLPHDFTKSTDPRQKAHVEKYGDMAVELDALPTSILKAKLRSEVEALMDLEALKAMHNLEVQERQQLADVLQQFRAA